MVIENRRRMAPSLTDSEDHSSQYDPRLGKERQRNNLTGIIVDPRTGQYVNYEVVEVATDRFQSLHVIFPDTKDFIVLPFIPVETGFTTEYYAQSTHPGRRR